MYTPKPFAVTDPDELEAMLAGAGFGVLVSQDGEGLQATHLPLLYDAGRRVLAGHMARPNGQALSQGRGLAIVQGPNAYVSPNWYPSKARDGRAVPTWNYEALHVQGWLSWFDDADWKWAHLTAMTARFEAGEPRPWTLDEAPEDYLRTLFGGIVGVELAIDRVEGKRKLSQNQPEDNRLGVIAGLEASGDAGAQVIATMMRALKAARR